MRVLIVAHGHPGFSIGGAEMAAHNLFRAIAAAPPHEAFFLACAPPNIVRHDGTALMSLRQGAQQAFLHTRDWDHFFLSNGALDDLTGAFAAWLDHVRPDVLHFHHVIGFGVEALAVVRRVLPHAAIVLTLHEYLAICAHHGQMVKRGSLALCREASPHACAGCFPEHGAGMMYEREQFLRHHLQLADAYVAPSRFLIDRYAAWGLPAARFSLIENGLDARPGAPRRALPTGMRRDRFGFFGQLTEFKGLLVLLDAVARLPAAVWGDATLSLFGGNLERQPEAFRKRFAELLQRADGRVRFAGSYRADELPRLMEQVDWTVIPSIWWENSPLVIQESFLHRRPPIVADIGGMAEKVRDGVDGLHFRAGSAQDLAERMAQALADPALCDRLAGAAPRPPTLAEFAASHLDLYRSLLPAAPAGRPKGGARRTAAIATAAIAAAPPP